MNVCACLCGVVGRVVVVCVGVGLSGRVGGRWVGGRVVKTEETVEQEFM